MLSQVPASERARQERGFDDEQLRRRDGRTLHLLYQLDLQCFMQGLCATVGLYVGSGCYCRSLRPLRTFGATRLSHLRRRPCPRSYTIQLLRSLIPPGLACLDRHPEAAPFSPIGSRARLSLRGPMPLSSSSGLVLARSSAPCVLGPHGRLSQVAGGRNKGLSFLYKPLWCASLWRLRLFYSSFRFAPAAPPTRCGTRKRSRHPPVAGPPSKNPFVISARRAGRRSPLD